MSKLFFVHTRLIGRQGRLSLDICPNFHSFFLFWTLPKAFVRLTAVIRHILSSFMYILGILNILIICKLYVRGISVKSLTYIIKVDLTYLRSTRPLSYQAQPHPKFWVRGIIIAAVGNHHTPYTRGAKRGGALEHCSQKEMDRAILVRRIWLKFTALVEIL